MSRRRDLERRLDLLSELREIMNAMKNLALMEMRKVSHFQEAQRRVLATLEAAATDLLMFHPQLSDSARHTGSIYLLIGSERGLCGDFNERILQAVEGLDRTGEPPPVFITVGEALGSRVPEGLEVAERLPGPTTAEEVGPVMIRLMDAVGRVRKTRGLTAPVLSALSHEEEGVKARGLLPLSLPKVRSAVHPFPPHIHIPPDELFLELVDHYLYAALHEMFYTSFLVENRRRLQHMESAVQRIEKDTESLALTRNALRQEEITEEIEVIMLSVSGMRPGPPGKQ